MSITGPRTLWDGIPVSVALEPEARREVADEFVEFSLDRFGSPDFERHTLSKREAFFDRYDAMAKPQWSGPLLDSSEFRALVTGAKPLDHADPLMSWLARATRTHVAEAWAVRHHLRTYPFSRAAVTGGRPSPLDLMTLQELYHTRMFVEVVRLFGLEFSLPAPPRALQVLIRLASRTVSHTSSSIATGIAEVIGSLATNALAHEAEELLVDHPATYEVVRTLVDEVFIDEIGHMTLALNTFDRRQRVGFRLAMPGALKALALTYYRGNRAGAAIVRRGYADFHLGLFPPQVLAQAFVPSVLLHSPRDGGAP